MTGMRGTRGEMGRDVIKEWAGPDHGRPSGPQ